MNIKIIVYVLVTIMTVLAMDSININAIFKKNKVFQARLFYLFLIISIIYLVTNFIFDCVETIKIF